MSAGKEIYLMVRKMLEPVIRDMRLMISRVVADIVDDSSGIQDVQGSLLAGEIGSLERMQNFGFTSVPFSQSSEGIAVFVNGQREHGVIVVLDDRSFRKTGLTPGQTAVYDFVGSFLHFKGDGTAELQALSELSLGNTLTTESALKGETFQAVFNSHVHIGNLGFATSPPSSPSTSFDLSLSVKVGL